MESSLGVAYLVYREICSRLFLELVQSLTGGKGPLFQVA